MTRYRVHWLDGEIDEFTCDGMSYRDAGIELWMAFGPNNTNRLLIALIPRTGAYKYIEEIGPE